MKTSKILPVIISLLFFMLQVNAQTSTLKDTTFKVFGVCEQCKDRIENAVKGKGVRSAVWNVDSKILSMLFNPSQTSVEKIQSRIISVGHDLENKKSNDAVYKALPECCHYREIETMIEAIETDTFQVKQPDSSITLKESINNLNKGKKVSDKSLQGVVMEENKKGEFIPLQGATVTWVGTNKGTTTDSAGVFKINHTGQDSRLVISYTGYKSDTISMTDLQ